jgi:hypothetical protein
MPEHSSPPYQEGPGNASIISAMLPRWQALYEKEEEEEEKEEEEEGI